MNRFLKNALLLLVVTISAQGCALLEKWGIVNPTEQEVEIIEQQEPHDSVHKEPFKTYQMAKPMHWQLINTNLDIDVNIPEQYIKGTAQLTLKPHNAFNMDSVVLDAKGMVVKSVKGNDSATVKSFKLIKNELVIELGKTYSKDTIKLSITYRAGKKIQDSLESNFGYDEKGIYFINPTGELNGPTQVWTQGETEFSSCWFPTIDQPNQKTTQTIKITVDTPYTALSNGRFVYMLLNEGGTRTFCYKQDKPHAPYLFMMGIGKFFKYEDTWNDSMAVDYYVDQKYAQYAKLIFGNTPEMLTFFSKTFGYKYPWDKYAQMVVKDFVSGAMENTGAVLHMSALHRDSLSYNDHTYEDYIAHELAHQWFGNLVTCKSWANLTLNEGFATYAEYLWDEYKYGSTKALETLRRMRASYFNQSNYNSHKLIEHGYADPGQMFDAHSYQKGALIQHLLRHELGDAIWKKGMSIYLNDNAFGTADIHHLQHAMEKASGLQLDEFFDQWFMQTGHPELNVQYNFVDSTSTLLVEIKQNANNQWPLFKIKPWIYWEIDGRPDSAQRTINGQYHQFKIPLRKQPDFVLIDHQLAYPIEQNSSLNTNWVLAQLRSKSPIIRLLAWDKLQYVQLHNQDSIKQILAAFCNINKPLTQEVSAIINLLKADYELYARTYPSAKQCLLSKQKFPSAQTINYLHQTGALGFAELEELKKLPSYNVRFACIEAMAKMDYEKTRPLIKIAVLSGADNELYNAVKIIANQAPAKDIDLLFYAAKKNSFFELYLVEAYTKMQVDDALLHFEKLDNYVSEGYNKSLSHSIEYKLFRWKVDLENKGEKATESERTLINKIEHLSEKIDRE
ncbi:MAG: M1 family metallopeptidase [Bacteroidetes bacterium]|nr:M1 family metallopeptidase [Bacteroidota bacterium]